MSTDDRINQLIMQLLRDTLEGKVSWRIEEPPRYLSVATDILIPAYYSAKCNEVDVAVYEARFKYFHDEDVYTWANESRFAILQNGIVIHNQDFSSPALHNLLTAVRAAAGGLNTILDSLLRP